MDYLSNVPFNIYNHSRKENNSNAIVHPASFPLRKFLFSVSDFLFSRLSYIPLKKHNYGYPYKRKIYI